MRAYERLLKYTAVNTTSHEEIETTPTGEGEFELARLLAEEMEALGLADVMVDAHAYAYGSRADKDYLSAAVMQVTEHLAQLLEPFEVYLAVLIRKRRRAYLYDYAPCSEFIHFLLTSVLFYLLIPSLYHKHFLRSNNSAAQSLRSRFAPRALARAYFLVVSSFRPAASGTVHGTIPAAARR